MGELASGTHSLSGSVISFWHSQLVIVSSLLALSIATSACALTGEIYKADSVKPNMPLTKRSAVTSFIRGIPGFMVSAWVSHSRPYPVSVVTAVSAHLAGNGCPPDYYCCYAGAPCAKAQYIGHPCPMQHYGKCQIKHFTVNLSSSSRVTPACLERGVGLYIHG